jgi:hypothetical protein
MQHKEDNVSRQEELNRTNARYVLQDAAITASTVLALYLGTTSRNRSYEIRGNEAKHLEYGALAKGSTRRPCVPCIWISSRSPGIITGCVRSIVCISLGRVDLL